MLPLPAEGRVYTARRRVRLGDAAPDGRVRLDAVARYLHDVAEDDAAEVNLPSSIGWVLRRTRVLVERFPTRGEPLELATFCSGVASRWAERTTTVAGAGGGRLQATSVWVAIDLETGSPARLDQRFADVYGPSAGSRRASARLVLDPPPPEAADQARPWPLRTTDLDAWGHVNNAISWAAVEDRLEVARWLPLCAEVEHPEPIAAGSHPLVATASAQASAGLWLLDGEDGRVLTAARVRPLGEG